MSTTNPSELVMSSEAAVQADTRTVLISGPGGAGKTTLSLSASRFAGDTIPAPQLVRCNDVLVFQGDNQGVQGALDAGFSTDNVINMCACESWKAYQDRFAKGLMHFRPRFANGQANAIRVIVIDLALPNRLIDEAIDPAVQKDWKLIALEGTKFYRAVANLRGVTVIGNAQIKAASSPGETQQAVDAANARAPGGERATYTIDLYKGFSRVWVENASLQITRTVRRLKDDRGGYTLEYATHTISNPKYEAKSRFRSKLKAVEDGASTLHSLLQRAYGENY